MFSAQKMQSLQAWNLYNLYKGNNIHVMYVYLESWTSPHVTAFWLNNNQIYKAKTSEIKR